MKRLIVFASFLLVACGGKQTSTVPGEQTDECIYQEEVCREAFDFQDQYMRMTGDEKDQMTPVLNSYIEHCEAAKKACKKSSR